METPEELRAFIEAITEDDVWGRLLHRGAAWALMRSNGVFPEDAPRLGETIETDLAEHGFAVLRAALALREREGPSPLANRGFERAANAFESLVRNGDPEAAARGFYRTLAASCYHLSSFSAVAFSLFGDGEERRNSNPAETAIELLILRDMGRLKQHVRGWLEDNDNDDASLAARLEGGEIDADEAVGVILNAAVCRALAYFDFALQTGNGGLVERSRELLDAAVELSADANNVPLWWIGKVCRALIEDLWSHSLHVLLPLEGPDGGEEDYPRLRRLFIASLYARRTAEVELWPSQRAAAARAADVSDDLVVALPTSAGKTRVAEIASLMALSTDKRVLIVTPLRALSAQTERAFRKTFSPLGFSVSSLYGASGVSAGDADALRSQHIVIATPEKLDFALRNDATLIDDVGLIVLDEGHMIGPSEREIRYEILVQRLLRRADASRRRIVCLSAILPGGDELNDLTAWLRSDVAGDAVRSEWRPTRQRFGTLLWAGGVGRLNYDLDNDGPYVGRFVTTMAPITPDRIAFPRNVADVTLQTAWEFAAQGKRTLIFSTQANWVEGYGERAVRFVERGYLPSLLEDPGAIERALVVGREWLGAEHPAVAALAIGVAIHHGRLPSPFLRELEILLADGTIKVIVASPTLSQGLNLNAAVLLVPYLVRAGAPVSGEEFANVAGRAGRAFVDTEGLIVHVVFDQHARRLRDWRALVDSIKARTLKSGLIQVVWQIILRLADQGVLERPDAIEYLSNAREAWVDPPVVDAAGGAEQAEDDRIEEEPLSQLVERLDATVFGLIEALDADSDDLPRLLDEALNGSLWARQLAREDEEFGQWQREIIQARARLIWRHTTPATRKGHFAMGVGLEAGLVIDGMAAELAALVDRADLAALSGDVDALVEALSGLAERLLSVRPFVPDKRNSLPANWRDLLSSWVSGAEVEDIGAEWMRVIEDAFMYRLVWALEAIRTRRASLGWEPEIVAGGAAAVLETGVPRMMMAMLIRAGLPSRKAAISAIEEGGAWFATPGEMRAWLAGEDVEALSALEHWPTTETAGLWQRFRQNCLGGDIPAWRRLRSRHELKLEAGQAPPSEGIYRVEEDETGLEAWLMTPDFIPIARLREPFQKEKIGVRVGICLPGQPTIVVVENLGASRTDDQTLKEA